MATRSTSVSRPRAVGRVLAGYSDVRGLEHALVLVKGARGLLLIDSSTAGELVVAELEEGEGAAEARAILSESPGCQGVQPKPAIEGYLARAARSAVPLCRSLRADDLETGESSGRQRAAA